MDLTKYKKRLGATSMSEAYVNDTIAIINADFTNAPSYRQIQLNGVDEDCTFNLTKESNKREILLRPRTIIKKGMYVQLESNDYIVTECVPNEIYPKAEIVLCNNTLRWRDTLNVLKQYSCIIKGDSISINNDNTGDKRLVIDSIAELKVIVPYNDDTKTIEPTQRFVFDGNAFDVTGIDRMTDVFKDEGLIILTVKATAMTDTDDVVTNVADDSGNSNWGGGW
jgi:hypothetical protein